MKTSIISAYSLIRKGNGKILSDRPFDIRAYSRFKHGSFADTQGFAGELSALIRERVDLSKTLIASAPYFEIPSPASHLTRMVNDTLGLPMVKITKHNAFAGDYGKLSPQERRKRTDETELSVPDIAGKEIVLIDDVRITGQQEEKVKGFLQKSGVAKVTFVYIAQAKCPAETEHEMNYAAIDSLRDLIPIVTSPQFLLTSRLVKYILSQTDHAELVSFLNCIPKEKLKELGWGAKKEGLDLMPVYLPQYSLLRYTIVKNEHAVRKEWVGFHRLTEMRMI